MTAKVVGFISEKGGVGKTTACYHVGIGLHRFGGLKVLILDADYQRGGMTGRLRPQSLENFRKGKAPGTTLFHVYQSLYGGLDDIPEPDVLSTDWGVDLIPSDPRLMGVTIDKMPGGNTVKETAHKQYSHLSALATAISGLKDKYHYILIDTHPEISDLLKSVIFASDYCVTPSKLDQQSTVGVPSALEAIKAVNDEFPVLNHLLGLSVEHRPTQHAGSIGMMGREYGQVLCDTAWDEYNKLKRLGGGVFEEYTTEGDGLRDAAQRRVPVYDVGGGNAKKQSEQFQQITAEFLRRCPL